MDYKFFVPCVFIPLEKSLHIRVAPIQWNAMISLCIYLMFMYRPKTFAIYLRTKSIVKSQVSTKCRDVYSPPPLLGGKAKVGGGENPPQAKKWGETFLPTGNFLILCFLTVEIYVENRTIFLYEQHMFIPIFKNFRLRRKFLTVFTLQFSTRPKRPFLRTM